MMKSVSSPRLVKAQQLSRVFRLICRVLLVFVVLLSIGVAIPMLSSLSASAQGQRGYAIGGAVIGFLSLVYGAAGMWALERLFNVFVTQRVFDPSSGLWLKRVGFWVATVLSLPVVARMALDWAVFGRLGAIGEGQFAPMIGSLLVGLFLMMLGWVLEEGSDLQAEQDLTI